MSVLPPWRLRHQLFLLAAAALLPIAILGAWGIHVMIEERQREIERNLLELSRAIASAIDAELDAAISSLRALSYSSALAEGDVQRFYEVARSAQQAHNSWAGVTLTDGNGTLLFKTVFPFGETAGRVIDTDSVHRTIAAGAPSVGRIMAGQVASHAFPVRVPVFRDGELAYVLTAAVKPDRILAILRQQSAPQNWIISVIDASGLRVARSRDHESLVGTQAGSTITELMQRVPLDGTGITRTREGGEVITGFTKLPQYGWSVAIGTPTAEIKAALVQTFALYSAALLASLAVFMGLAIIVSRRIVAGIGALQEQALRLGEGRPVMPAGSRIRELNEMELALHAASSERIKVEREREALLDSLNNALAAQREALLRAEEAGRAKDQFLAMLGHELRNPLGPIVAALHLMELHGDRTTAREREIMARQVEHMRRLVDDLLDVARIVRGKLPMRSEPVAIDAVLDRALEAVRPIALQRWCDIRVNRALHPTWVLGDEARLVQVVTNLLSNALRFDPTGEISVDVCGAENKVRIRVHDHGAGMTEEVLHRVFDPFYQAPQSIERSAGGLGLGLAIVRSIVEAHGGAVCAESPGPGKGCMIEVALPAIAAPTRAREPEAGASSECSARILIVDDNADAAEAVGAALHAGGHEVRIAHDGRQALRFIEDFKPDVAILDIGLPDMDGYELARTIRKRYSSWSGKIIALTGYGQESDRAMSAEAGFDLHLTKPAGIPELNAALDALLAPALHQGVPVRQRA